MPFPFSIFSALGGSSEGVPQPPTQWTGGGKDMLDVGFPVLPSSSDCPALALGVGVLGGQGQP